MKKSAICSHLPISRPEKLRSENLDTDYTGVTITLERKEWRGQAHLGFASPSFSELYRKRFQFMHPQELERLDKLSHPRLRFQFLAGRYTAKLTLASFLKMDAASHTWVKSGVFCQPIVECSTKNVPGISIAHTRRLGGSVVFPREHPMAIDLECPREDALDSIIRLVTPIEQTMRSQSDEGDLLFYTRLWTVKEALSKVLGTGLMTPIQVYEVNQEIQKEHHTVSYFTNFSQYQAISFRVGSSLCSLVLPRLTQCYPSNWVGPLKQVKISPIP